jgi:CxxC motif-containing protein (DUF1111 family)
LALSPKKNRGGDVNKEQSQSQAGTLRLRRSALQRGCLHLFVMNSVEDRIMRGIGRMLLPGRAGSLLLVILAAPGAAVLGASGRDRATDQAARGRELFTRTWKPDDPRSHGGDGLGPVFNERSCAACHHQGGPGGGGSSGKNVDVVTVFSSPSTGGLCGTSSWMSIPRATPPTFTPTADDLATLAAIHPGFATSRSVVLHRFGLAPYYENWRRHLMEGDPPDASSRPRATPRSEVAPVPLDRPPPLPRQARYGSFQLRRAQRNSTALFGSGLIDSIPDAVIEAAARATETPTTIPGRVSRLKDGRIGRFGWKAQQAHLEDFVLEACSVELGLEVPGHPQAGDPLGYGRPPRGVDMTRSECDDLIAYVRSLPAPVELAPPGAGATGAQVFARVGCAACHVPTLGNVQGIYSDLLLHYMGDDLASGGGYGTASPPTPVEIATPGSEHRPATEREWRTPPLWGVRDSAPYLHDGRAPNLEMAIKLHTGEGLGAANAYRGLPAAQRHQLLRFLNSLAAPREAASAREGRGHP